MQAYGTFHSLVEAVALIMTNFCALIKLNKTAQAL